MKKAGDVKGFDYGQPPTVVADQEQFTRDILEGVETGNLRSTPVPHRNGDTQPISRSIPRPLIPRPQSLAPLLVESSRVTVARLDFVSNHETVPGFVLEFNVVGVSIREHSISLRISSGMMFEPKDVMEFVLRLNGATYPVMWAGGTFDFPEDSIRGICFIRKL